MEKKSDTASDVCIAVIPEREDGVNFTALTRKRAGLRENERGQHESDDDCVIIQTGIFILYGSNAPRLATGEALHKKRKKRLSQ